MSISSVTTNVISSLGNNSGSILPLFAKDAINSAGVAYVFSRRGGKHDGKEKAIEEFGTQAIWLLGIPVIKKIFDATVYKIAKVDPSIDIRKFKLSSPDNIQKTLDIVKNSADKSQLEAIEAAVKNQKLIKGLFISKFAVATLATVGALHALISYKQKTTERAISDEVIAKSIMNERISSAIQNFHNKKKEGQVSFKGAGAEFLSSFMYNPVRNMSILDGSIFAKRMQQGRKGEKGEIAFKEISTIGFMYVLAKPVQKGLEWLGQKITGIPLGLDYKLLASDKFKNSLKDGSLSAALKDFPIIPEKAEKEAAKAAAEKIIDFVRGGKAEGNAVIETLKTSGEIKTVQETGKKLFGIIPRKVATDKIDALSFIDTDDVNAAVKNLKAMSDKITSDTDVTQMLKKAKQFKAGTTFANVLIAAAFLAVIQPLIIIAARKHKNNGDPNNPAIRAREEELKHRLNLA